MFSLGTILCQVLSLSSRQPTSLVAWSPPHVHVRAGVSAHFLPSASRTPEGLSSFSPVSVPLSFKLVVFLLRWFAGSTCHMTHPMANGLSSHTRGVLCRTRFLICHSMGRLRIFQIFKLRFLFVFLHFNSDLLQFKFLRL